LLLAGLLYFYDLFLEIAQSRFNTFFCFAVEEELPDFLFYNF